MRGRIEIAEQADRWTELAAATIGSTLGEAIAARGRARFVLSGGSTPGAAYRRLAEPPWRARIDWPRVEFFWGDERCVPPDHPASNFRLAREALLGRLTETGPVHRIHGERGPGEAAFWYDQELRTAGAPGEPVPRFELILLGLGADGHVASLFPGTPTLRSETRLAIATRSPEPPFDRVTITLRVINAARAVVFLVRGSDKARALARALECDPDRPDAPPAALVRPSEGSLVWIVDRDAAGPRAHERATPDAETGRQ